MCRLDCGIVVCYVISKIVQNEVVPHSMSKTESLLMRAQLLKHFTSHPSKSWTLEKEKEMEAVHNLKFDD